MMSDGCFLLCLEVLTISTARHSRNCLHMVNKKNTSSIITLTMKSKINTMFRTFSSLNTSCYINLSHKLETINFFVFVKERNFSERYLVSIIREMCEKYSVWPFR
jgi:hypothetical protein